MTIRNLGKWNKTLPIFLPPDALPSNIFWKDFFLFLKDSVVTELNLILENGSVAPMFDVFQLMMFPVMQFFTVSSSVNQDTWKGTKPISLRWR